MEAGWTFETILSYHNTTEWQSSVFGFYCQTTSYSNKWIWNKKEGVKHYLIYTCWHDS